MTDARPSLIPFLVLVVFTFVLAAFGITFVITLNWLYLGAALVVAGVVAWAGRKVVA